MVNAASRPQVHGDITSTSNCSGGLAVWYDTRLPVTVKGTESDFVATTALPQLSATAAKDSLAPQISKLVYTIPTDSLKDLTEERNGFESRSALLKKHPNIQFRTRHRDAHIYVFPRWVMDLVQENEDFESIGEDVMGWWAKAGWRPDLYDKMNLGRVFGARSKQGDTYSTRGASPSPAASNDSAPQSPSGEPESERVELLKDKHQAMPPILAYINPTDASAPMIRRVDTAQLLLAVSLQLAKLPSVEETALGAASPFAHSRKVAYPEGVKPRTTITKADCLVAENVTVAEKTSIKESVIGANCQIHEGAKLSQCLLMDGVIVEKGCKLTKCILGKRSRIGEGSILTECEVQEHLLVEPNSMLISLQSSRTHG
jgi:translation initiation factor eIF-2B subunit gamma